MAPRSQAGEVSEQCIEYRRVSNRTRFPAVIAYLTGVNKPDLPADPPGSKRGDAVALTEVRFSMSDDGSWATVAGMRLSTPGQHQVAVAS